MPGLRLLTGVTHHFLKKKEGDCGENATKSILSIYGLPSDISISDKGGTSPQKITNTLKKQGINTEVKDEIGFDRLRPRSIVYYPDEDHYVSIEDITEKEVLVNDSSKTNPEWLDKEAFEKKWKGWAVETKSPRLSSLSNEYGVIRTSREDEEEFFKFPQGKKREKFLPQEKVEKAIVHVTGTPDEWEDDTKHLGSIYDWQVRGKKWKGIGYHYLIGRKGEVYQARNSSERGAHAKAKQGNINSLGIAFLGTKEFTPEQHQAFSRLSHSLVEKNPKLKFFGHKEIDPGKPLDPPFDYQSLIPQGSWGMEKKEAKEKDRLDLSLLNPLRMGEAEAVELPHLRLLGGEAIFDPEGTSYDYETAQASGGRPIKQPDGKLHWGSLDPRTGMVLKGRQHKTWDLMVEEEKKRGNKIVKRGDRYYSVPEDKPTLRLLGDIPSKEEPSRLRRAGKIITEAAKGFARGFENIAGGFGATTRWIGEIVKEEPPEILDRQGILRKPEWARKLDRAIGESLTRWGITANEFWREEAQRGIEAPSPDVFRGSFMQNPSWTRGIATVAEALPSLATATAVTFATGNPLAGAVSLGLIEGSEQYVEARKAGKDVEFSSVVGALSTVGVSILEVIPLTRFLRGGVGKLPVDIFVGAAQEGGEEVLQALWTNAIAKIGYDKTRDLTEGMVEGFIGGAGSGGLIGGITSGRGLKVDGLMEEAVDKGIPPEDLLAMQEAVKNQIVANEGEVESVISKSAEKINEAVEVPKEIKPIEEPQAKVGLPEVKEIDISKENPMAQKLSNEEIPLGNTQGAKIAHYKYYAGPFKQSLQNAVKTHPKVVELFARSGTLSRIIDMVVRDPKAQYSLGDIDTNIIQHHQFIKTNPEGVIRGYNETKRLLIDTLVRETGLSAQALGELKSFRKAFFALSDERQRNFNTVANSVANQFFKTMSDQVISGIETSAESGMYLFINRNLPRGTERTQGIFNMAGFLKGARLGEGARFDMEKAVRRMSKFLNRPSTEVKVADAFDQIEQAESDVMLVSNSPYAEEIGYRVQTEQWTVDASLRLINMLAEKNKTQGNPVLFHDTWNEILVNEWKKLGYRVYPVKVKTSAGKGFGLKREMFVFAPGRKVEVVAKPAPRPVEKITGYRSEEVYGEGYRDIEVVVKHEVEELGNEDIIDTLIEKGLIKDRTELDSFIKGLKDEGYTEVVWLSPTKKAVIDLYEVSPESVEKHDVEGIVISDLGDEGKLVAYKPPAKPAPPKPPKPPKQLPVALAGPPEGEHFDELADYFARAGEEDVAPRLSEEDIKKAQAEWKIISYEARNSLFESIKELGKIKPYAKGYLKEELARIPNYLRTRAPDAMTADEMAGALAERGFHFEGDMDLITAIGDEVVFSHKAKIEYEEAKRYLRDWAKRLRARTKATEKFIRSIGKMLSRGTLRGPAVKKHIRLVTGQSKVGEMIKAEKFVQESLKKAEAETAQAYKIGRKHGIELEKARLAELRIRQRANKAVREEVKDLVDDLKKLSLKGLPIEYQDRLGEIIAEIDLEHLSPRSLARRDSMRIFAEQQKEAGEESNIPQEKLDDLEKISPAEMTIDELREVHRTIMRLYHQGKLADKLLTSQKDRTFDEVKAELIQTITEGRGITEETPVARWVRSNVKGFAKVPLHAVKIYIAEHLRPEVMIEALDNYETGINTKVLWDPVNRSQNRKSEEADKTINRIKEIHKDIDIVQDMHKKIDIGRFRGVTKDFAFFVYANSFNTANKAHLYGSGITDEDIAAIEKFLSPQEKATVRGMIEFYDKEQYPAIDKVYVEMEGVHMSKEDFYFPILRLEDISYHKELEKEILQRAYVRKPGVSRGFAKPRVTSTKGFSDYSYFTVITKNWQKVEHYKAFMGSIRDVNKVLSNKEISRAIQDKFGREFSVVLDKWLKDVAYGGKKQAMNLIDRIARFLRLNFVTSVLGFNIMTAAKAPVSYLQGAEFVGKEATLKANYKFAPHPFKTMEFVANKSPMMKHRGFTQEREFQEILSGRRVPGVLGRISGWQQVREKSMAMYLINDKVTTNIIWLAGYDSYIEQGKDEAEAIAWADRAVRRTQPMGGVLHLPGMFRGNEYQRMYTMFKNQLNQNFNLVYELYQQYGRGKTTFSTFVSGHLIYLLASGFLIGLLSRKRMPKDWKEVTFDALHQFTGSLFILGNLMQYLMDVYSGKRRWNALGAITPPPFQTWEDISRFFTAKTLEKRAKHAARAAAKITGIPYTQAERLITGQPFGKIPDEKKKPRKLKMLKTDKLGGRTLRLLK